MWFPRRLGANLGANLRWLPSRVLHAAARLRAPARSQRESAGAGQEGERARAADPVKDVRLPTGKLVMLLLGLCRQGQPLEPIDNGDGRLWFRWRGLRGGVGTVGIYKDHPEELAVVERAARSPRAYVELLAIITCVGMLGNERGGWAMERVAELLYGPRTASSHRERQVPPLRAWLALLEHGYWKLDTEAGGTSTARRRSKKATPAPSVVEGPLLAVEAVREGGRARTLVPAPALLAAVAGGFAITVPAKLFRLPDPDHRNPEGNLPSLAIKARVRLAAAIATRWRQATDQPIRNDELLTGFAGVNLERVQQRGHISQWTHAVWDTLRSTFEEGGPGLTTIPIADKLVLRTKLRLAARGQSGDQRPIPASMPTHRRRKRAPG